MTFEEWTLEIESFAMRIERMHDDLVKHPDKDNIQQWLKAAWEVGYEPGLKEKNKNEIAKQTNL